MEIKKSSYRVRYSKKLDKKIGEYVSHGFNNTQIAAKLGIDRSTFWNWRNKHPTLSTAIKEGEKELMFNAEKAAFRSGLGYEYEEKKIVYSGKSKTPDKIEIYKKYAHPNSRSLQIILEAGLPEKYGRNRIEIAGEVKHAGIIDVLKADLENIFDDEE